MDAILINKNQKGGEKIKSKGNYSFIMPLTLFILVSLVFLLAFTVYISLTNVKFGDLQNADLVGMSNFQSILTSKDFWNSMKFSLKFSLSVTILETFLGFLISYYIYKHFKGNKIIFTLLLAPIMMAPSLYGLMNRILLNNFVGLIPGYLSYLFGINIDFFNPNIIFYTLVAIDVLQWTPFIVLIVYSALLGIPKQLFEAAYIDGANSFQILMKITIPYVFSSIVAASSLRFLEAFRSFDTIYVLTGGGPGDLTTTISIYIYKVGFQFGRQGLASAAGLILFLLMMILTFNATRLIYRRW
ncbi:MAG: multiple sugar transport system permease protein [Thermosipho sp. (in: thermotogales)]|nr:multiple sugar transport system permease protein [Thermosipho sp. (in: thermotogales)]